MARTIGVARKWYQGDHYDITKSKRRLAVKAGAVEITWRQAGAMMRRQRTEGGGLGPAPTFEGDKPAAGGQLKMEV